MREERKIKMITRAAVQVHIYPTGQDLILPVHRHPDYLQICAAFGYREWEVRRDMDGFLTDDGTFLDREQAAQYAFENGQITEPVDLLFSEDLW